MKQGGFQNKQSNGPSGAAFGDAASKKQALLEKMKKQQLQKQEDGEEKRAEGVFDMIPFE